MLPTAFVNQPHKPEDADERTIPGTDDLPQDTDEIKHTAKCICACGQYHSNLSPDALYMRQSYLNLLKSGGNPMEMMMKSMMWMKQCSEYNEIALKELIEDDLLRKELHVEEVRVEVKIDNTAPTRGSDQEIQVLNAFQQMASEIVAPIVQRSNFGQDGGNDNEDNSSENVQVGNENQGVELNKDVSKNDIATQSDTNVQNVDQH